MNKKNLLITGAGIGAAMLISLLAMHSSKYAEETISFNHSPAHQAASVLLRPTGTRAFMLDTTTVPESIGCYAYYAARGSGAYFTLLNRLTRVIYFYDYRTGELEKVVKLDDYGYKNSDNVQGYNVISPDSLFVYDYKSSSLMLISLQKGRLLNRTIVSNNYKDYSAPFPFVSTNSPILFDSRNRKVFLAGYVANEGGTYALDRDRKTVATLDLNTGQVDYTIRYPPFYWGKNWGGAAGYRRTFFDFNPQDQKLVVSFMADHNITVYDTEKQTLAQHYAGSRLLAQIKSMKYSANYFKKVSKVEKAEYLGKNSSYGSIIYDPYRNLYYRVAYLPKEDFDVTDRTKILKRKSVIILDKNFVKIGESLLPSAYYDTDHFFVAKEGLYFRKIMPDSIDNKVAFERFEIAPVDRGTPSKQ